MRTNTEARQRVARTVQVNVPYRMLVENKELFDLFLAWGLNPELGMDIPALDTYGLDHFRQTAEALQGAGARITFHGPFEGVDPGSADANLKASSLKYLNRLAEVVAVMRPVHVVCHTGFQPETHMPDFSRWCNQSRSVWAGMASTMAGLGAHLLLENVHERTPLEMASIVSGIPLLGACLDTGHLHAYGDGDLSGWVERLGPITREIHLHDNHGGKDEHLPPGQGEIDFRPLFKGGINPHAIIALEPHKEADLWPSLDFLIKHPIPMSG